MVRGVDGIWDRGAYEYCTTETISGTLDGDIIAGIDIELYTIGCSGDMLVSSTTSDSAGQYIFSSLSNGYYKVKPVDANCSFDPQFKDVPISRTLNCAVDFTSDCLE